MTVVGRKRRLGTHLREIWSFRELLAGLIRKELKVRYKNSILGFVWSMIQPVFLLVVYNIVFSILGEAFDRFPIWLLCGLVIWTFIATSFTTSVQSITANAYLVSKVRFPRAILPLSTVGAAAVHLALQMGAFAIVLVAAQHPVDWSYMWLLVPAIITAIIFCCAAAVFLSALNVKARDTQHLLEILLLGWFWLTPMLYTWQRSASWLKGEGVTSAVLLINPITSIVTTFQRAIYGVDTVVVPGEKGPVALQVLPNADQLWYLRNLGIVALVSAILFGLALNYFDKAEANFAEDL